MYLAMGIAASGIRGQQTRLDNIANNIANVNTAGFKSSRLDFKDALYTAGFVPGPAYTPEGDQQRGSGVLPAAINVNYRGGSLQHTENLLDFSLEGDGFFQVENPQGERLYTRAGNFYTNYAADGNMYLVNREGNFVLNADGNRIQVPAGTTKVDMGQDGTMTFRGGDVERTDRFGIYTFANKTGLSKAGDSNYVPTAASGEAVAATECTVKQGYLEGSNVDMATEMTLMIRSSRAFSLAAKALTTADDMEGIANNMRR